KLAVGEEAVKAYETLEELWKQFQKDYDYYYRVLLPEYDALIKKILKEVNEKGPFPEDEVPIMPSEPQIPINYYAEEPRKGYAVDLPAGRYQIRLVDGEGKVIPDSKKNLVVFSPRREGIGYLVIPVHKWTMPFQSSDPSRAFYLDGHQTFYVQAFNAAE